MNQPVESVAAPAPTTGSAAALFGVLLEPRKTFESLKPSAPWILPLVVILLAVAAFTYVNWPYLMDQRTEAFQSSDPEPGSRNRHQRVPSSGLMPTLRSTCHSISVSLWWLS